MSDLTIHQDIQATAEMIVKAAENIVVGDDQGCRDVIDLRVSAQDTLSQIDSAVSLHIAPVQAKINEANKQAQKLKSAILGASTGFEGAIYNHLEGTGAQRLNSGAMLAYFRKNDSTIKLGDINEKKLPDKFFTRKPHEAGIKKHIREHGKAPKGVEYEEIDRDPSLLFKAVK